jgi:hypothetical protein
VNTVRKQRERERRWPNLRCYHAIFLKGLSETTNNLFGLPDFSLGLEHGSPEYEPLDHDVLYIVNVLVVSWFVGYSAVCVNLLLMQVVRWTVC